MFHAVSRGKQRCPFRFATNSKIFMYKLTSRIPPPIHLSWTYCSFAAPRIISRTYRAVIASTRKSASSVRHPTIFTTSDLDTFLPLENSEVFNCCKFEIALESCSSQSIALKAEWCHPACQELLVLTSRFVARIDQLIDTFRLTRFQSTVCVCAIHPIADLSREIVWFLEVWHELSYWIHQHVRINDAMIMTEGQHSSKTFPMHRVPHRNDNKKKYIFWVRWSNGFIVGMSSAVNAIPCKRNSFKIPPQYWSIVFIICNDCLRCFGQMATSSKATIVPKFRRVWCICCNWLGNSRGSIRMRRYFRFWNAARAFHLKFAHTSAITPSSTTFKCLNDSHRTWSFRSSILFLSLLRWTSIILAFCFWVAVGRRPTFLWIVEI